MTIQKRIDAMAPAVGRRAFLKGAGGLTFAVTLGANVVSPIGPADAAVARGFPPGCASRPTTASPSSPRRPRWGRDR